jgi:hypothetical protein
VDVVVSVTPQIPASRASCRNTAKNNSRKTSNTTQLVASNIKTNDKRRNYSDDNQQCRAGYLEFLDDTQGDVLNNFDAESRAANGARALLAITMLFTYPMEAFVVRHISSSIFFARDLEADQDLPPPLLCGMDMNNGCCNWRRSLTFAIYLCTLVPALIFDDRGPILSVTGGLGWELAILLFTTTRRMR